MSLAGSSPQGKEIKRLEFEKNSIIDVKSNRRYQLHVNSIWYSYVYTRVRIFGYQVYDVVCSIYLNNFI